MSGAGTGLAWGSVLAGVAAVATLPLAVFLTRFSESYELLHAGFAIPVAAALGMLSVGLSRRSRRRSRLSLGRAEGERLATAGRILGIVGVCMAVAAVVSLAVFGLLEYVGTRD